MQCFEKFVKVDDDWYPNYDGDTVLVSLREVGKRPYSYIKFSAWGADDTGVEMDLSCYDECIFNTWKEYIYDRMPDVVNREWFYEHGFYRA